MPPDEPEMLPKSNKRVQEPLAGLKVAQASNVTAPLEILVVLTTPEPKFT